MRIAIVGAGIAGLCCAHLLSARHEITLFEADARLGGHTNTVDVRHEGRDIAVDTGFIVFNERNYPGFCALLARLGIESAPTTMSFSVRCDRSGLEYGGASLRGLFAQPTNLFRPSFLRMVRDIARLGREGKRMLADANESTTIADLCASGRFSRDFLDNYLIPMGAAIWSAPRDAMLRFPARFFLQFFDNHGMLDLRERPVWRTIPGGARRYVDAITAPIRDRCRADCPVKSIARRESSVDVQTADGAESFDHVILATHADQSLALLADPSEAERSILAALPFQRNDAVLHTDISALPRRRIAWSGWNYRLAADARAPVGVTYNMTILQNLQTQVPLCVTLNPGDSIDPAKILRRFVYHHPLYTLEGVAARARWSEISAVRRTHFCGAYWRNGFHEDGVQSALAVCRRLGESL